MDCFEVDVELFIKCRLCLEDSGSFQIVPSIIGQINDCFAIQIDPFDGLPQLICKKCKTILNNYYNIKNMFREKQQQLLQRLRDTRKARFEHDASGAATPAAAVAVSATVPDDAAVVAAAHAGTVAASAGAPAADDAVGEPAPAAPVAVVTLNDGHAKSPASVGAASHSAIMKSGTKGTSKKRKSSWKKKYNEHFVCNICNKNYLMKNAVEKHVKTHKTIMRKYDYLFMKYATVLMNKIDGKKKNTNKNVVYDKVKIISPSSNSSYCSYYLKKERNKNLGNSAQRVSVKRKTSTESCSSDINKGKKRKSRRLSSTSSTPTVVLANTIEQEIADAAVAGANDLINLDDTSSDCPAKATTEQETKQALLQPQPVKAEVGDYKAIQNIVTMCHKNYIKKLQSETNNTSPHSESSLKHKVLSIGRKVINKQGFSCTGILRYAEHKDLEIKWAPSARTNQNKAYNFVRIMTKLKSREETECDDAGWINMYDAFDFINIGTGDECEVIASVMAACQGDHTDHLDKPPLSINSASETNDLSYKNKLLNKTPVANPKQLPKGSKALVQVNDAAVLPPTAVCESDEAAIEGDAMCLPIITSTTSLSNVTETTKPNNPLTDNPLPRIKVKPAYELMSERALSNRERTDDMWAFNMCSASLPPADHDDYCAPPVPESQSGYVSSPASAILAPTDLQTHNQSPADKNHDRNEYVILNSIELPNTKTKSPFNYFKRVLLVHGLKLLELNADLQMHPQFKCLVKFKLMMKQDSKSPIGVYLSLFCDNRSFCFVFKDANLKFFDPNQLPAYWQWELLKIYQGTVVRKILQKAASLGKEAEEFTKHFLCLLQSINLVTES